MAALREALHSGPQYFRFEVDADEVVTDSLVPLILLEAQIVEVNECWQGWVLSDLRQDSELSRCLLRSLHN